MQLLIWIKLEEFFCSFLKKKNLLEPEECKNAKQVIWVGKTFILGTFTQSEKKKKKVEHFPIIYWWDKIRFEWCLEVRWYFKLKNGMFSA